LDDCFRLSPAQSPVRWTLGCRSTATASGRQVVFARGEQELVWKTLWPGDTIPLATGSAGSQDESVHSYRLELPVAAGGVRLLQVFELRKARSDVAPATFDVAEKDGQLQLAISTPEQRVQLTLPAANVDAGWIAIQDANGDKAVPLRPLASGVLPHGPAGVQMIERWDSAYRAGRPAGWDTGLTAPPLKDAVESGVIKPCRVIAFGCGTGTNEIYLAGKGFDVTAVDVAPSALGLAAEKAKKAGVQVRWLLADVLALPDLEPFDLVFDRGCYHHVRYVDAAGFVETLRRLTHPGSRCLILSCNNDRPPGVREQHMRDDFSALFDFEWLRDSAIEGRDGSVRRESWSLMLRRKAE
jgi:SAM-dependent methyltransferase